MFRSFVRIDVGHQSFIAQTDCVGCTICFNLWIHGRDRIGNSLIDSTNEQTRVNRGTKMFLRVDQSNFCPADQPSLPALKKYLARNGGLAKHRQDRIPSAKSLNQVKQHPFRNVEIALPRHCIQSLMALKI
jgi:hypothetical protein